MILAISSVAAGCELLRVPGPPATPVAIDSYCSIYQRVQQNAADSKSVKQTTREVQSRINKNDLYYRCTCEGWTDPVCQVPPR
jgi:hypothetical protein